MLKLLLCELLHLDDDAAVLGRGVEDVVAIAVGDGLDVAGSGTELVDEEVLHGLATLLGELLVDAGGTGLLVGGASQHESGVGIDHVVGEVLEVGLLTLGELGGTQVEVNGSRGGNLRIDSGEAAILEEVGLAVDEVLERSELLLEVGDLVLEVGVLLLEGGNLSLQGVVVSLGERERNDDRHHGSQTVETGTAEVELQAEGSGRETDIALEEAIHVISLSAAGDDAEVEVEVHALAKTQAVEEADTGGKSASDRRKRKE